MTVISISSRARASAFLLFLKPEIFFYPHFPFPVPYDNPPLSSPSDTQQFNHTSHTMTQAGVSNKVQI